MFYSMVGTCKIILFNIFITSRSCGKIRYFDQNNRPGKMTLQILVLIIKYLGDVPFG